MSRQDPVTSPYSPDLSEVRAWLERMVHALKFVELVAAVLSLVMRMRDINAELLRQLTHLRRKRPRSETLKRLERQLLLPLNGIVATTSTKPEDKERSNTKKSRKGRHPGRAAPPAHLQRVPVPNPVPAAMRICPRCGAQMQTVGHSSCLMLASHPELCVGEPDALLPG